jgi:hypothetical protein
MGNYLLKHFLSEKKPKESKLTVHTSGDSLIKMDSDMSVRGNIWENIPSVRITKSLMHYGALWGARQEALTVGPSGLPSTFTHPLPFPLCLHLFLMRECGSDIDTNKLIRTATSLRL